MGLLGWVAIEQRDSSFKCTYEIQRNQDDKSRLPGGGCERDILRTLAKYIGRKATQH